MRGVKRSRLGQKQDDAAPAAAVAVAAVAVEAVNPYSDLVDLAKSLATSEESAMTVFEHVLWRARLAPMFADLKSLSMAFLESRSSMPQRVYSVEQMSDVYAHVQRHVALPRTCLHSLLRQRLLQSCELAFADWRRAVDMPMIDSDMDAQVALIDQVSRTCDLFGYLWQRTLRPFFRLVDRIALTEMEDLPAVPIDTTRTMCTVFAGVYLSPLGPALSSALCCLINSLHWTSADAAQGSVSKDDTLNSITSLFQSVLTTLPEFDFALLSEKLTEHYSGFVSTAVSQIMCDDVVMYLSRASELIQHESTLLANLVIPLAFSHVEHSRTLRCNTLSLISRQILGPIPATVGLQQSLVQLLVLGNSSGVGTIVSLLARHFEDEHWQDFVKSAASPAIATAMRQRFDTAVVSESKDRLLSIINVVSFLYALKDKVQAFLATTATPVVQERSSVLVVGLGKAIDTEGALFLNEVLSLNEVVAYASLVFTELDDVYAVRFRAAISSNPTLRLLPLLAARHVDALCSASKRLLADRLLECNDVSSVSRLDALVISVLNSVVHPCDDFITMRSMVADTAKSVQVCQSEPNSTQVLLVTPRWPLAKSVTSVQLQLPPSLHSLAEKFVTFMHAQPNVDTKRRLTFLNAGSCVIDANIGRRRYTIKMSTLQACVLLSFEDRDRLSLEEIARVLGAGVEVGMIKSAVRGMRLGTTPSSSLLVPKTDGTLVRNDKFEWKDSNVDLLSVQKQPSAWLADTVYADSATQMQRASQPARFDKESLKHVVQAMVLRIAKKHTSIPYMKLVECCREQFLEAHAVKLDVRTIKESIDKSLSSDFIERRTASSSAAAADSADDSPAEVIITYVP